MAGNYTKVFSNHLEEGVYTFTLSAGTNTQGLKLRITSLLVPDLMHEVAVIGCSPPPSVTPVSNVVWVCSGTFTMGSPASEAERWTVEGPQTDVTISRGFWIGRYEVTQREYLSVMRTNPSGYTGNLSLPVDNVTWFNAVAYCEALTIQERQAGHLPAGYVYRLPTEAEWEYACRAGTVTTFSYGSALRSGMANFYGLLEYETSVGTVFNSNGVILLRTAPVGSYGPNPFGLYDMHGNLWEWCADWWGGEYPGGSVTDPRGPGAGSLRVTRGGSFYDRAATCRSAFRYAEYPFISYGIYNNVRWYYLGFRIVLATN